MHIFIIVSYYFKFGLFIFQHGILFFIKPNLNWATHFWFCFYGNTELHGDLQSFITKFWSL